jgi:hypothetical protein
MLQPQGKNGRLLAQRNAQTDGFVRFIAPRFLSQEATSAPPSLRYGATNEYADAPKRSDGGIRLHRYGVRTVNAFCRTVKRTGVVPTGWPST